MNIIYRDLRHLYFHPYVKSGVYAAASALLMLIIALVFWMPKHNAFKNLSAQVDNAQFEISSYQKKLELISSYNNAIILLPKYEEKIDRRISQSDLVSRLSAMAKKLGVTIDGENYSETHDASARLNTIVELELHGEYQNIKIFIGSLDKIPVWTELQESRLERYNNTSRVKASLRFLASISAVRS